jgi:hypothetical protein
MMSATPSDRIASRRDEEHEELQAGLEEDFLGTHSVDPLSTIRRCLRCSQLAARAAAEEEHLNRDAET